MNSISQPLALREPPQASGLPLPGNTLQMARGPVFRVRPPHQPYTVIAGIEAASFTGSRAGKDSPRSKEFWQGQILESGATRMAW